MKTPHVHVPYERIEQYLRFIIENHINPEIYFSSQSLDAVHYSDIIRLRDNLDYNPSFTIHAPFMDLSPGAVDSKIREVTIGRFSHVLDIAEILKPKAVVFHSGYEKWKYSLKIDLWLEKSLMTWRPLIKRAADRGLKIAVENIFEDEPTNLRLLMEATVSENFGVCFDTGHFNLFSRVSLDEWMRQLKPYIIELHLHDNDKTADDHIAIGEGTFDFEKLFALLEDKDIIYTIEGHTPEDVLKSIRRLKGYL
ncbi:MAG: sugar phosphate isomerase/epimerase [Nitrospira sp.]|nr:sugar phosphate isomerase/epimerase [Nitrospira sp.]